MTRWRCRAYHALAVDSAEGTLSDRQQARLERHLARCPACAEELEGLHQLPMVLKTAPVPDPGEAFWQQQRQAIGRAIRTLSAPAAYPGATRWFAGLQQSAWRYPLAATAALLMAIVGYRLAERPPVLPPSDGSESAVAALDPQSLAAVHEILDSLIPHDAPLVHTSPNEDASLAALPTEDIIGGSSWPEAPRATDLTEDELDRLSNLVGGIG